MHSHFYSLQFDLKNTHQIQPFFIIHSCYARSFKLTHFELSLLEFFSCLLSLFFLDEKSNQKNQVFCINSKIFAKNSVGAKKNSSASPDSNSFSLNPTTFLQKLEFLQGTPKRVISNKIVFQVFCKKNALRNMSYSLFVFH